MFSKNHLLRILKNRKINFLNLAISMNVPKYKNREFSRFLFDLTNKGIIFQTKEKEFFIPEFLDEIEGTLKVKNGSNYGFVNLDESNLIFILGSNFNGALHSDLVRVKYFKEPSKEDLFQGVITKIIKRNKPIFVGRVQRFENSFTLVPNDKNIKGNFLFENENKLKNNMQVKVEIVDFEKKFHIVKVLKIIGMQDEPFIDILSTIEDANVLVNFSKESLKQASFVANDIKNENLNNRKDLRKNLIYTIDGDNTKDFDDAIEVEKLDNGNYILQVHIADVTHYVKENTALDQEAFARSTSIYLPDRVIPMLPENLSNGICSINPHVDRLTISCQMEIDQNGETISSKIFPSVINSKYRLTYKQVNNFKKGIDIWNDSKLTKSLKNALELSKIIRNFKDQEGYVDFDIDESEIIIDSNGKTKDIVIKERSYSEIMIEDFMVRTNETIAKFIALKKFPFIYRVNEKPTLEKIEDLRKILKILNLKIKIPSNSKPLEFASSIKEIKKSEFAEFLKIIVLRTMSKAMYSEKNIGHFGLASKFYTHFTSPIRRYPDLIVHRMIREYIFKNNVSLKNHFAKILPQIAKNSSFKEQEAIKLERKVNDLKKVEFYQKLIGTKIKAQVVSVLKFGLFLEFPNKVNGLVHVSSLIDGEYNLDESGFGLTNGKRVFKIGDILDVIVFSTNKEEVKIDLVLEEFYEKLKASSKQNLVKF